MRDSLRLLSSLGGVGRLALLGGLATVAAVSEAASATLIFVFLQLVADPGSALELPIMGDVTSTWPTLRTERGTIIFAVVLGIFFVLQAVLRVGQAYAQQRHAHTVAASLSHRLVEGYLALPYAVHIDRHSAALLRNATETAQRLAGQVFLPLTVLVADSLVLLALALVLATTAPLATAVVIGILAPLVAIGLRALQVRLRRLGKRVHELTAASISTLQQGLLGIRDVHLFAAQHYFSRRFGTERGHLARAQYLRGAALQLPGAALESALMLFIVGFFVVSVVTQRSNAETLATLGLFGYAGLRLLPALKKVILAVNQVRFNLPAVDELRSDMESFESTRPGAQTTSASVGFERTLSLVDVAFRYPGSANYAVQGISLTIPRGSSIGICGRTGSGKTTLLDLFTGLLTPTEGHVYVDGAHLHDTQDAWRKQLGVVSQVMFFLDDTLRQNVAFGVSDDSIDEGALLEAVRMAQLGPMVDSLPHGLETRVGEMAVKLSGGQRQRIAIARALYRRPSVLIFDEGTSALDNLTESDLMEAIREGDHTRTLILVAHRLSTLQACDQIVYLEQGRIIACGSYEELLTTSEAFRAQVASG